jgi:hypothetical protein
MPKFSIYDDMFIEAFGRGVEELPEDKTQLVKDIVEKIHEQVIDRIEGYIRDEMASKAADELRDAAAKMAESMLSNALAGDDETIRNLFGFNEWYMSHLYIGPLPTQWALIDAIAERRPDIFANERIKQRDAEIVELNRRIGDLKRYFDHMKNPDGSANG